MVGQMKLQHHPLCSDQLRTDPSLPTWSILGHLEYGSNLNILQFRKTVWWQFHDLKIILMQLLKCHGDFPAIIVLSRWCPSCFPDSRLCLVLVAFCWMLIDFRWFLLIFCWFWLIRCSFLFSIDLQGSLFDFCWFLIDYCWFLLAFVWFSMPLVDFLWILFDFGWFLGGKFQVELCCFFCFCLVWVGFWWVLVHLGCIWIRGFWLLLNGRTLESGSMGFSFWGIGETLGSGSKGFEVWDTGETLGSGPKVLGFDRPGNP